jgi:hypothetical protein
VDELEMEDLFFDVQLQIWAAEGLSLVEYMEIMIFTVMEKEGRFCFIPIVFNDI